MTYKKLLARLQRMKPEQLAQKVRILDGASGAWHGLWSMERADEDIYRDEEAPGERRHQELSPFGPVNPVVKKGMPYLLADD